MDKKHQNFQLTMFFPKDSNATPLI